MLAHPTHPPLSPLPERRLFFAVLGGMITLAWLTLWLWDHSPWGRYLHHFELGRLDSTHGIGPVLTQGGIYVVGWLLMIIAMMLPSSVPLLNAFRRMTALRADRALLFALVIGGYLTAWLGFGVAAHLFDYGLHEALERSSLLQTNTWVFGAGPLLVAGLFQFSTLKHRCLERCRLPAAFVIEHWRGGRATHQAMALGLHHGLFCVGCCWAMMLLMFAVGTGNLAWMFGLGAIMSIEKNFFWARHLSAPLGVALILWAGAIAVNHTLTWQ